MDNIIGAARAHAFYNAVWNGQRVMPCCDKRRYTRSVANLKVMRCKVTAQKNILREERDGLLTLASGPGRCAQQWQKNFRSDARQVSAYVALSTRFCSHQIPADLHRRAEV